MSRDSWKLTGALVLFGTAVAGAVTGGSTGNDGICHRSDGVVTCATPSDATARGRAEASAHGLASACILPTPDRSRWTYHLTANDCAYDGGAFVAAEEAGR